MTERDTTEVHHYSFVEGSKAVLLQGPLNILLVCIPLCLISSSLGWSEGITFTFALLALAPIAERLGYVTEQLAIHTNETIGGLLNATFGNATELIVAIAALNKGLFRLVQLSLLGSILSNMLLVLGMAFFCGGLKHKVQTFNKISSQVNSTLLMLSTAGVLLPTILTLSGEESRIGELGFSRYASIFLFVSYFAFLYFQLISHKDAYDEDKESRPKNVKAVVKKSSGYETVSQLFAEGGDNDSNQSNAQLIAANDAVNRLEEGSSSKGLIEIEFSNRTPDTERSETSGDDEEEEAEEEEDDDEDEDVLGMRYGIVWLAIITVFVTVLSEIISSTIQEAATSAKISAVFLSAIVLPIVGNAAEHAGAVLFAMKGKVDLSLGVAIGSSTQIALLVLPLLVLLGWIMDKDMYLNFGAYESACLVLTVVCVTFAIKDGTSNWLLGFSLMVAYGIISVGFWAHKAGSLTE